MEYKFCISPWVLLTIPGTFICLVSQQNHLYFVYQYPNVSRQALLMGFCTLQIQLEYSKLSAPGSLQLNNSHFFMFLKLMYNTNKIPDLGWNLTIFQRYTISNSPGAPLIHNHIVHEPTYKYLHKDYVLYIWTLFPLCWASKYPQLLLSCIWVLQRNYWLVLTPVIIHMFYC